jgi:predicted GIY-YIG superfamily endonuclease
MVKSGKIVSGTDVKSSKIVSGTDVKSSKIVGSTNVKSNKLSNNFWCCYLLRSLDSQRTYIGSTNNFPARLNKHNSSTGAKYTMGQTWLPVLVVHGFHHKNACLSFESGWKKVSTRRSNLKLQGIILTTGTYVQYTFNDTIYDRIIDLLYFVHNTTLLDTKYIRNDPVTLPINPPDYHLVQIFTAEYDVRSLPWPYFMDFYDEEQ